MAGQDFKHKFEKACDLYHQKDFDQAKRSFEALLSDERPSSGERRDCLINIASCLASLGLYRDSLERYNRINLNTDNNILYNRALCNYKLSNLEEALDILAEIQAAYHTDEAATIAGNRSPLIESLNLKSAILFKMSGASGEARQLVATASEKDPVALHNRSIYTGDIESAFNGLKQLLALAEDIGKSIPIRGIPPETIETLLRLTLIKGDDQYAIALIDRYRHDGLSRNSDLLELYEILADRSRVSSKTTCKKLELFLEKAIGKYGDTPDDEQVMPLIGLTTMQLSAQLWQNNHYSSLERILLKVEPILGETTDFWPIWFAHSLFMQDTRYEECCYLYEKFLSPPDGSGGRKLLAVDPIVLANLCVAYLLTGQNESAESLIKEMETEESKCAPINKRLCHSCIVNLTIGQLYCVKLNFAFGLLRIFKSLEPLDERLSSETWLICKRCILSLLDNHCKSMIYARDDLLDQVITFLIECEQHGVLVRAAASYEISANLKTELKEGQISILLGRNSVTYEARYLRSLILTVLHD